MILKFLFVFSCLLFRMCLCFSRKFSTRHFLLQNRISILHEGIFVLLLSHMLLKIFNPKWTVLSHSHDVAKQWCRSHLGWISLKKTFKEHPPFFNRLCICILLQRGGWAKNDHHHKTKILNPSPSPNPPACITMIPKEKLPVWPTIPGQTWLIALKKFSRFARSAFSTLFIDFHCYKGGVG